MEIKIINTVQVLGLQTRQINLVNTVELQVRTSEILATVSPCITTVEALIDSTNLELELCYVSGCTVTNIVQYVVSATVAAVLINAHWIGSRERQSLLSV